MVSSLPWPVVAGTVVAVSRRPLPFVLTALLVVLTFETGDHSVHHLTDAAEPSCVVATVASDADALGESDVAPERPASEAAGPTPGTLVVVVRAPIGVTETRAPPASSSRLDTPARLASLAR